MQDRIDIVDNDHIAIVAETTTDALRVSADFASAIRNSNYSAAKGDMGLVCSAPIWVVKQWCNNHGITWDRFTRSNEFNEPFLNSPENAPFRTWAGSV